MSDIKAHAEVVLPTENLNADMDFFEKIGFRLEQIFPADDPAVAVMSGHGLQIRLDREVISSPVTLNLLTDNPGQFSLQENELRAPNGTILRVQPLTYQLNQPKTRHRFESRQLTDKDPWVIGRAGMMYRDLIPDRLGGSIIASHIRIPQGGPVPDMVHYHTIGFQLIFCYRGWVELVYEDQGAPFVLQAGECVIQPPQIRHQVLVASDNLEVIEIGVPAEHMTTIDHEMVLPNNNYNPERVFSGQKFCRHRLEEANWTLWRVPGFKSRETGIRTATNGVADVRIIQPDAERKTGKWSSHDADILFTFLTEGSLVLEVEKEGIFNLNAGDAFVVPPDLKSRFLSLSPKLEFLEVALPGTFKTTLF